MGVLACGLLASAVRADDDDLDDVLGGFEHEEPGFEVAPENAEPEPPEHELVDVSGSIELTGSVNFRSHSSDTGTDYQGLQRLRFRQGLQLDADLPWSTHLRLEGWAFYDAAYAIQGRDQYTSQVLRDYELDADVGEAWLRSEIAPEVDVTVGRQIVVWGRSESLRVLDVLNPLDQREPGRADLEYLRLPVTMLRVEGYAGHWSATGMAIPEVRFDELPVVGSDFYPDVVQLPEQKPRQFGSTPEFAAALNGIFPGWDVSFNGAWFWNDEPRLSGGPPATSLKHDRLWLLGSSGNYTTGGWLLKYETAVLQGLRFFGESDEKTRFDLLLGAEYYGLTDTTIVVEGVNRHLFDHDAEIRRAPNYTRTDSQEIALRISRNFFHDTLHATLVGILLGWDARDGSLVRFDLDYDVRDALVVGVGVLLYQTGDVPPFDAWADNDRALFRVKWSF
jgi:Protein of unknown function (DUF1302)